MKRTTLTIIILAILVASFLVFTACDEPEHTCSFGEWTVIEQPNCTEAGLMVRVCECGESRTQIIPAGHSYTHVVTDPTCTEQGFTTHTCACGDSYVDAYVDALGHDEIGHIAQAPTCTEVGWDAYVTCSRCDYSTYVEIPAGHSYSSVVTDPTCTEQGYTTHTCACGDSYVDTYVDALGHTWGEWYEIKAPALIEAGEERRDCGNCDCYETNELPALGYSGTWGNLTWILNKNTGELVISGTGEMDAFENYSTSAWRGYKDIIKSVTIENGVTTIGSSAFDGCSSLTSITIPDSVTTIGDGAFRYCSSLTYNAYDNGKYLGNETNPYLVLVEATSASITSCEINENCKVICGSAFSGCSSLTSIVIPDGVTTIGNYAFYNCTSLTYNAYDNGKYLGNESNPYLVLVKATSTSITLCEINENCKVICGSAFANCDSLISITIPDSVTTIGEYVFAYCDSLTSVTIGDSVTTIGEGAFYWCDSLTSIVIPDSVTTIGKDAFYWCDSLTSVTIGDNVTTIGSVAFSGCKNLTSIVVDENNSSYKSIDGNLYSKDGKKLVRYAIGKADTSFTIPDSVTTIGDYAFRDCRSLTSIVIPNSVTTIGKDAFYSCKSLTSIVVDENNSSYKSIDGNLYSKDGKTLVRCAIGKTYASFEIPDGVTAIGDYAFEGCNRLTSIEIPDGVTTIGTAAFGWCTSLTSVTFGANSQLTTIGNYAFNNCSSLTSITIPDSVTTIGEGAFDWCTSLTSIVLPDSVTSIGSVAFNYCDSLTSVTFGEDSQLMVVGDYAFYECTSLTNVSIPDSVTTICYAAFAYCTNLTNVTFGENSQMTAIGDGAFYGCVNLTSVIFGENSQLTTIGNYAFYDCTSLTSIVIPDSVTTIGYIAFKFCSSLTDVYFTGTEEQWNEISIGSYNDDLLNATIHFLGEDEEPALINGTWGSLTWTLNESTGELVISGEGEMETFEDDLTSAWREYKGLIKSVTIENSVTSIGVGAFYECINLTSIEIPNSVTTIGASAFYECESLTSIVIPDGVTTIGLCAFFGCTSLTSVTFEDPYGWSVSVTDLGDVATNLTLTDAAQNAKFLNGDLSPSEMYIWSKQ